MQSVLIKFQVWSICNIQIRTQLQGYLVGSVPILAWIARIIAKLVRWETFCLKITNIVSEYVGILELHATSACVLDSTYSHCCTVWEKSDAHLCRRDQRVAVPSRARKMPHTLWPTVRLSSLSRLVSTSLDLLPETEPTREPQEAGESVKRMLFTDEELREMDRTPSPYHLASHRLK